MENNKKRQIFTGKGWLGIFILVMFFGFGSASAQEMDTEAYWKSECGKKQNLVSCTLKEQCAWYSKVEEEEPECIPKTDKSKAKAESKWVTNDCGEIKNSSLRFLNEIKDYVYSYKLTEDGEIKNDTVVRACEDLVDNPEAEAENSMHVCDYSEWLTWEGKYKCRSYNALMGRALSQECLERVEIIWEGSLKDRAARENKQQGRNECDAIINEYFYQGPVFDGPGLSGGAQMAQMELSSSISKQRDIKKLLIGWSKFAIQIAIVLAVIAIIWAGIRFITDMGDGAGVEAGKKIIMWTIVGLILIMASYAIVNTVIKARFGSDLSLNTNINHFIT